MHDNMTDSLATPPPARVLYNLLRGVSDRVCERATRLLREPALQMS